MYHITDIIYIYIIDILYTIFYIVYVPFSRSYNYLRYFTAGRKIAY